MSGLVKHDPASGPVLDAETWQDLWAACGARSPDFLIESVRLFEERRANCERELEEAFRDKDRSRLRKAAHALAGSAAIIGAVQLHDRAAVLEINLDLAWDDVARVLTEVRHAGEVARRALWEQVGM